MPSNHSLWLAYDLKVCLIQRRLHDAVVKLNDQHILLIASIRLRYKLHSLYLVVIEPSAEPSNVLLCVSDHFTIAIFCWYRVHLATEDVNGLLDDVCVGLARLLVEVQPGVRLVAHESYFSALGVSDQENYVAIGLLPAIKATLFDHLGVVNEADELPLTEMHDALWHVKAEMHYGDLLVVGGECLVGHEWVVDDPGLTDGLLGMIELDLFKVTVLF